MKTWETSRLILRPWELADAEDLYRYAQDPDVGPNAGWKPHESLEESRSIVESWVRGEEGEDIWAIVLKETGHVVGSIGLHHDAKRAGVPNCRSLGYVLAKPCWGHGYMTEAVHSVLRYGFTELGLSLVTVTHYAYNQRSRRVIEKCGFHYEGTLRQGAAVYDGRVEDLCCYSMTAEEYASLAPTWNEQ